MTVIVIDNYDSFTLNLVALIENFGFDTLVYKNDQVELQDIERLNPECLVLSPGPSNPSNAGITLAVIHCFAGRYPMIGVCLGHQAIAQAYGASIIKSYRATHGKAVPICHHGRGIFKNIPSPYMATRYNSLAVDRDGFPDCLEILATENDDEGEIMGLRHRQWPLFGVQFHPESILSHYGYGLFENFFNIIKP